MYLELLQGHFWYVAIPAAEPVSLELTGDRTPQTCQIRFICGFIHATPHICRIASKSRAYSIQRPVHSQIPQSRETWRRSWLLPLLISEFRDGSQHVQATDSTFQMGALQFIENMDRTTLTISDEEFEKNVEAAVSAIAEKHRLESPPTSATSERGPEPFGAQGESSSPRPSMDRDAVARSSYTDRRSTSSNEDDSGEYDEKAAITGLLRSIQRPLSTIAGMFTDSEEPAVGSSSASNRSPAHTPQPEARAASQHKRYTAEEAAARQASAETAEAQRLHRAEHANIVETLAGMFPDLDKDIISDVVYQKEGRYVNLISY